MFHKITAAFRRYGLCTVHLQASTRSETLHNCPTMALAKTPSSQRLKSGVAQHHQTHAFKHQCVTSYHIGPINTSLLYARTICKLNIFVGV